MKLFFKNIQGKLFPGMLFLIVFFPLIAVAQQTQEVEARLMKEAEENIEKYRKGDVMIQFLDKQTGKPITNTRVEIRQKTHDFLFGCIIFDLIRNENPYRQDLFKERFSRIFNLAVFPFYWPGYENTQGMPGWENMLPVIDWCKVNGITTKGHPLVWACSSGAPAWLRKYNTAETEELLKTRVINIVSAFEDKIELWDVVNEPVNVKTWRNKIKNMDDPNDWGVEDPIDEIADYVENALLWANQANPKATLLINEYRTIADPNVRQRYFELLTELKERKAPFAHVGIQGHEPRQEWFNPEETWKTFDLYSDLGYTLHITEFHPQSSGVEITGGWRTGKWTPETQKEFTEQFVKLCFGHPAVASINWWGFSDRNIWLPGGGLVDEEYRPKPVYEMLDKLINETWRTNLEQNSGPDGKVDFRGFYGKYEVSFTMPDGRVHLYPVHIRKDEANEWVFRVVE
jgi:endo-1,4-beta-xylanase